MVGREWSGVGTGVESAEVSYRGRWGFCNAGCDELSSALSLSMLEAGVSFTFGVVESLDPSNSCTCRSKYCVNLEQSTTVVCSFFNWSP